MNHPQFSFLTRLSLLVRRPGFRTVRGIFLSFLALAVVLGIAILFNSSDRTDESVDESHVADTKLDSYERVLEEGNAEEVVAFLKKRNTLTNLELPVRIEHFQNRIRLAERLSQISTLPEHQEISVITKIEARLFLIMIYQTNRLETNIEAKAIEDLVVSMIDSEQPKIRRKLAVADLFVKMERLRVGEIEEAEITRTIDQVAQDYMEDEIVAGEVTRVLDHYSSLDVDVDKFLIQVTEVYAASSNAKVQDLVVEIQQAFFRRTYGLLPLSNTERNFVSSTIQERTAQAEKALGEISSQRVINGQNYGSLLMSLTILSQVAPHQNYSQLLKQAKETVGDLQIDEAGIGGLKALQQIVRSVGQSFATRSFVTADGENCEVASADNKVSFLFIVKSGDQTKPIERLESFTARFAKLIEDELMACKIVYVADEKLESEWGQLTKWAEGYPKAEVAHVRAADNVELFKVLSIPWSPCWMLFDSDQKLVEFNPLYPVLRSRLHLYLK